jgi:hypothetical protein
MEINRANDSEYVMPGTDSYEAVRKLVAPDFEDRNWAPDRNYDGDDTGVADIPSPTYDEMDELAEKYKRRLDAATTDEEYRAVLAEAWEEAAEMDLDGREPIGR